MVEFCSVYFSPGQEIKDLTLNLLGEGTSCGKKILLLAERTGIISLKIIYLNHSPAKVKHFPFLLHEININLDCFCLHLTGFVPLFIIGS